MKYIVPESKLYRTIYKMIDDFMLETEIQWDFGENPHTTEKTEYEVIFFGRDFIDMKDDYPLFLYVKEGYFQKIEKDKKLIEKYQDKTPFLEISSHTKFRYMMDSAVGDLWRPVFEEWWKNSFIAFPVKTFIYF